MNDGVRLNGRLVLTLRDEAGRVIDRQVHENSITNWQRAAIAEWLSGGALDNATTGFPSMPTYIALGTGTGTPSESDLDMYAETYGTRFAYSYRDTLQAYTAQITRNYSVSDPNGTFTEAGLWDEDITATSLGAAASAGATAITPASGAPAVRVGERIYIDDATNPEYATIAQAVAAGASSWTIKSGLANAHANSTTMYAFGGNLWAHVAFSGAGVTKSASQSLTAQWQIYVQAG